MAAATFQYGASMPDAVRHRHATLAESVAVPPPQPIRPQMPSRCGASPGFHRSSAVPPRVLQRFTPSPSQARAIHRSPTATGRCNPHHRCTVKTWLHNLLCTDIFALMTESPPPEIADIEALKALAHPRRRRILAQLTEHGPATSADLARALDLNTGATSYHLRELAQHGFIEEMTDRAHGRERWWKAVRRDVRIPRRSQQSPTGRVVADEISRNSIVADLNEYQRAMADSHRLGPWQDALPYSRSALRLTIEELQDFFERYISLVNRYRRPGDPAPDDAKTVLVRFFAFPSDDPAAPESPIE